jgi:hypothetical protein
MATSSDTQRTAIRERKRQAHIALRERHQRQEAAQTAVFSALDHLARHLDQAAAELGHEAGDPLERAATITTIAAQLATLIDEVRVAALDLTNLAGLGQGQVAELLGTRASLLFPRPRSAGRSAPVATVELGVEGVA